MGALRRPSSLIVLCFGTLCFSQTQQDDTFKFETKVNVVLVPVLVRDKHGLRRHTEKGRLPSFR